MVIDITYCPILFFITNIVIARKMQVNIYKKGVLISHAISGRCHCYRLRSFICSQNRCFHLSRSISYIVCVKDKTSINTTNRRNSSFFLDYSKFQGQFCFFFFFPPQFPFLDFFVTF